MARTPAWLLAGLVHVSLLAAMGWIGGGAAAPWLIAAMVAGQLLESAIAPDRPDTADASARVIGLLVLGVVAASLIAPGRAWPAGALGVLVGFGLRAWAIRTLGPLFLDGVGRRAVHPRVTHGPYRVCRHPGALGTLCVALGAATSQGSWAGLGLVVFGLAPALLWRVGAEDAWFVDAGCADPTRGAA